MHWSKSVSLVALILVAILVASGVGGSVWALAGPGLSGPLNGATTGSQIVPARPDLALTKQGVLSSDGHTMTYTITITNIGGVASTSPIVVDDMLNPPPAGAVFVSASSGWSCTGLGGGSTANCTFPGAIQPGNALTLTLVVDIPSGGEFQNCATVTSPSSAAVPSDPDLTNNTACVKTSVMPPGQAWPDLVLTKTAVVSADGQTVTYTLTLTNVGGIPVLNPSVNDALSPLPPGAQFVSANGTGWTCTGTGGPGPVNCDYAGMVLPNSPPLTITIVVAVGSGGDFENCATVSHVSNAAVPPDSNLANNRACVKTTVKPPVPTTTYIYSVKIVCGTVTPPRPKPSIPTLRDPAPVVPGLYRTAVNIHNFWEKETTFLQKVAIALPQDQERGPITKKVKENLRPNEAVEVDCYNVVAILEGTTAAKAEFLKGFVVIESPVELEVTAVYTAEELQENGISIDVEQIQPHVIRQSVAGPTGSSACPPICPKDAPLPAAPEPIAPTATLTPLPTATRTPTPTPTPAPSAGPVQAPRTP